MMKNKKIKYLTLGTVTALLVGMLALSFPVFAQDSSPEKPEVSITVRDTSTVQIVSFIKQVWRESPLVLEAEAKMNAARAQAEADSKWLYNPEVEFEVEKKPGEPRTKLVGISQAIDWRGKFRASGEVAKFELQAAIAERDDARQTIALETLMALVDYQDGREILELSAERTKLMERFASMVIERFKAGDIDQSEYNLSRLAYSKALIEHADAESTVAEYKLALESPMGFFTDNVTVLPALPDKLPEIAMNGESVEQIIMKLPAIRMLQSSGKAAMASIELARRERVADPTVSLKGGRDEGTDVIGVSFSIPLNILNTYNSEVDVARHLSTAEKSSLQSAFHIAKSRLVSAKRIYELSASALSVWKGEGRKALEKQIETLDIKFKVGELSATDYLVQVEQTLDTKIAAKELHSKAWKAWFAWCRASGNLEAWLQGELR